MRRVHQIHTRVLSEVLIQRKMSLNERVDLMAHIPLKDHQEHRAAADLEDITPHTRLILPVAYLVALPIVTSPTASKFSLFSFFVFFVLFAFIRFQLIFTPNAIIFISKSNLDGNFYYL